MNDLHLESGITAGLLLYNLPMENPEFHFPKNLNKSGVQINVNDYNFRFGEYDPERTL